ncbi:hypothetical protein M0657_012166 [Pyricularia oryzae]|nr:hypothetical protein M0657_012166 [Pyricularia oryzae]
MDRLEGIQAAPGAFTRLALPNKNRRTPNKEIVAALWFLSVKFCSRLGCFRTKHNAPNGLLGGTSVGSGHINTHARLCDAVGSYVCQIDNRVEPVPREICCIQSRAFEQRRLTVLERSEVGPASSQMRRHWAPSVTNKGYDCRRIFTPPTSVWKSAKRHPSKPLVRRYTSGCYNSCRFFDVGKVLAKSGSAQIVGLITDNTLQKLTANQYSSRFGTASNYPGRAQVRSTALPASCTSQDGDNHTPYLSNKDRQSPDAHLKSARPCPNEVRKRAAEGGGAYPM